MLEMLFILDSELQDIIESVFVLREQLQIRNEIEHVRFVFKARFILQSMDEIMEVYRASHFSNVYLCTRFEQFRSEFMELIEILDEIGQTITIMDKQLFEDILIQTLLFKNRVRSEFPSWWNFYYRAKQTPFTSIRSTWTWFRHRCK